jgi:hypothetical protein
MNVDGTITKAKIDATTIRDLDDEQLYDLVYDKASQKDCGTFGEYFEDNDKDRLLQQIYATAILDGEVRNGGFDQFFLNNERLTDTAIAGLDLIDAKKHRDLLIDARKIYEEQKEQFMDERNPDLDEFDEKYYELDKFYDARMKFIRENIERLFD